MECNKCKRPMRREEGFGRQSVTNRNSGDSTASINGWTCFNCGNWVEFSVEPVQVLDCKKTRKMPIERKILVSLRAGIAKLNEYDRIVWSMKKEIQDLFAKNAEQEEIVLFIARDQTALRSGTRIAAALERFKSGRMKAMMELIDAG